MRTAALLVVSALLSVGCSSDTGGQAEGDGPAPSDGTAPAESPPASEGELVFESDFSSPEGGLFGGEPGFSAEVPGGTVSGEYTAEGTLSLGVDLPANDEQFDLQSIANTGGVFAGERELIDLADVSIQTEGTPLEWETGIGYGLHCREQTGEPGFHYEASISLDDFSNEIILFRADGPKGLEELDRAPIPDTAKTEIGESNLLRMDCVGDQITLHVNGEEVVSATDARYTSGMVSMFTVTYVPREIEEHPGASATAAFDNLEIREL